jgi:MATE family multidrug resistance protein
MIYFAKCKPIWVYLGQNENVASLAQIGLNGFLIGVVPDILKYAAFHYCISFGKTKIPMIANIVTLPLIYLVNTILAFGGYGFPEMGIYGLGIGTSFVDWIILILMIFYIYSHKELGKYLRIKNKLLEYKELILALFKLGAPIGLMFSIEISFFMAFSIMIGIISEDALAAYQISHQWVFTVVIIAYGLAEAVIILVGRAFGAKDLKLAQTYSFICIIISATVVSFASIFYWLIPDAFIGFDIDLSEKSNLSMVNFARSFLVFGGIFQIIDSIRIIISGSLRGMNYTQYPMWVTLITYWIIGFPLSYLLAFHFKMGVNGLWIGLIICASLNALFQYHKLHRVFFKKSSL